ncbi:hypothetical protein J1614_005702 [Plenodomus biglobosus]|nr:hypothetical protein J1614_005702 [Plenodomus biglobosus]
MGYNRSESIDHVISRSTIPTHLVTTTRTCFFDSTRKPRANSDAHPDLYCILRIADLDEVLHDLICLIGLVIGDAPLMIQLASSDLPSMLPFTFETKRIGLSRGDGLFLAESRRTLIFDLLVESVTVTHGGDMVASKTSVLRLEAAWMPSRRQGVHIPYHQP